MTIEKFQAEWDEYFRSCLPVGCGPSQVTETRRAFYAGGAALLGFIDRAAGPSVSEEESCARMGALAAELRDFSRSVRDGREPAPLASLESFFSACNLEERGRVLLALGARFLAMAIPTYAPHGVAMTKLGGKDGTVVILGHGETGKALSVAYEAVKDIGPGRRKNPDAKT